MSPNASTPLLSISSSGESTTWGCGFSLIGVISSPFAICSSRLAICCVICAIRAFTRAWRSSFVSFLRLGVCGLCSLFSDSTFVESSTSATSVSVAVSITSAVFSISAGFSDFLERPRFLDLGCVSVCSVDFTASVVVASFSTAISVTVSVATVTSVVFLTSAALTCSTGACVLFSLCAFFFFAGFSVFFSTFFSAFLFSAPFSSACGAGMAVSNNEGCTPDITGLGCGCLACSSLICPRVSSLLPTVASTRLLFRLSVFTF